MYLATAWDNPLTAKVWRPPCHQRLNFHHQVPKASGCPSLTWRLFSWRYQIPPATAAHWRGTLLQHTLALTSTSAKTGSWTRAPGTGTRGLQAPRHAILRAQLTMVLRVCPRQVPSCWFGHIDGRDLQPQHGGLKGSGCVRQIWARWGGAIAVLLQRLCA